MFSSVSRGVRGVAVFASLFPAAAVASPVSADWLPLDEGNEWILTNGSDAIRVANTFQSGSWNWLDGFQGKSLWAWQDADHWYWYDTTFAYNPSTGLSELHSTWYDQGEAWRMDLTENACDTLDLHLQAAGLTSSVFTGEYNANQYDFTLVPEPNVRCAKPEWASMTLAEGVGPVQIAHTNGSDYQLIFADLPALQRVEAANYGQGAAEGLSMSLILDERTYVNQPNSIRCITAPCPSNAVTDEATIVLRVENTSAAPITLRNNNGQRFELTVTNDRGEVVRRYSDGRFFTMALVEDTLEPGDVRLFTTTMTMDSTEGAQLYGSFVIHADVMGAVVTARTQFDVSPLLR